MQTVVVVWDFWTINRMEPPKLKISQFSSEIPHLSSNVWYIYLNLVDLHGKCIGKYTKKIDPMGTTVYVLHILLIKYLCMLLFFFIGQLLSKKVQMVHIPGQQERLQKYLT